MCDCLLKCCVSIVYIYHVNKFEARLLFLYLPLTLNRNLPNIGILIGISLRR